MCKCIFNFYSIDIRFVQQRIPVKPQIQVFVATQVYIETRLCIHWYPYHNVVQLNPNTSHYIKYKDRNALEYIESKKFDVLSYKNNQYTILALQFTNNVSKVAY